MLHNIIGALAISLLITAGFAYIQWNAKHNIKKEKEALEQAVASLKENEATINKELVRLQNIDRNRAKNLVKNIKQVESSNEKATCPMPNFLLHALDGLSVHNRK